MRIKQNPDEDNLYIVQELLRLYKLYIGLILHMPVILHVNAPIEIWMFQQNK